MTSVTRENNSASKISDSSQLDRPSVKIGALTIPVEVVSTTEAIKKGLAHRRSLKASEGMLFLFDHSALFKFWMKGMRFPIDIIWIGENRRIVDISANLPIVPLLKRAIFYSPSTFTRYVLEVNADFCQAHSIKVGDVVEFESIPA